MSSLSAQEAAASKSYMDDAERLLRDIVANCPGLELWRGNMPEKYARHHDDKPHLFDTLIVHQTGKTPTAGVWGEYVLYTQRTRPQGVDIDLTNGVTATGANTPFGGGHSPIANLEEIAKNLLYHGRRHQVWAFMQILEEKLRKLIDDASVEPVALGLGTSQLIRFDIIRGRFEWRRFCVAFVIDQENKAGVLLRKDTDKPISFLEFSRPYVFDPNGPNIWLEEELLEDEILDELTRELA